MVSIRSKIICLPMYSLSMWMATIFFFVFVNTARLHYAVKTS